MNELRDGLKTISELWPIITFFGVALMGYLHLRFTVSKILEDKIKEKESMKEKEDDIEADIKGVSQKMNTIAETFQKKFDALKDKMTDNHLEVSKALTRIEGALSAHAISKNETQERS